MIMLMIIYFWNICQNVIMMIMKNLSTKIMYEIKIFLASIVESLMFGEEVNCLTVRHFIFILLLETFLYRLLSIVLPLLVLVIMHSSMIFYFKNFELVTNFAFFTSPLLSHYHWHQYYSNTKTNQKLMAVNCKIHDN